MGIFFCMRKLYHHPGLCANLPPVLFFCIMQMVMTLENLNLIISLAALVLAIIAVVLAAGLQKMRNTFFKGSRAENLEQVIINQNKKLNELAGQQDYTEKAVKELRDIQTISIQKIGITRYNPFNDNGGNLSFSLAIMDGRNNGVVITSMHGREVNRIYAKPIKNSKSEFSLTEEERGAIESATNF